MSIVELYSDTSSSLANGQVCMLTCQEPFSYIEVACRKVWRVMREMLAIDWSQTWELVTPLANCKPIGLKWIFKVKKNLQGEIIKHKVWLIVKRYSQRQGIDYEEIFAPVAWFDSIRALIALIALKWWTIHHLDVKTTFFIGDIEDKSM